MELRPLGFGEIFDRAITLYIRNFIPFAGIVLVTVVPLAIVQYFVDAAEMPQFYAMMKILQHPASAGSAPRIPTMFDSPGQVAAIAIATLVFWLLWPFALNAVAFGVARLYSGRPVEFGPCYRATLTRFWPIIGDLFLQGAIFVAWYIAFLLVIFVSILLAAVIGKAVLALGIVVGILAVVLVLAMLLLLAPLFIALTFSMYAIVIEGTSVTASVGSGFARVFNRHEFWRSMLFSIAAIAVTLGASTVLGVLSLVTLFLHWIWLEAVISTLTRAAVSPFAIVLIAVYYFDVRIRREGFDLQAGLETLTGDAAAT
jgi:hypothetical protein